MEPFTSSMTQLNVAERTFTVRLLQMHGSTMLFISATETEFIDEMAVGMMAPSTSTPTAIATTIIGPTVLTDSQNLAEKLTKRYKRQFFVSNNTKDRLIGPQLERQLCDYLSVAMKQQSF